MDSDQTDSNSEKAKIKKNTEQTNDEMIEPKLPERTKGRNFFSSLLSNFRKKEKSCENINNCNCKEKNNSNKENRNSINENKYVDNRKRVKEEEEKDRNSECEITNATKMSGAGATDTFQKRPISNSSSSRSTPSPPNSSPTTPTRRKPSEAVDIPASSLPPIHISTPKDSPLKEAFESIANLTKGSLSPGYDSYSRRTFLLQLPTEYDNNSHDDLSADEAYEIPTISKVS